MNKMIQLDFFKNDEIEDLRLEIDSVRNMSDKVRKSVHAKIGKLDSAYKALEERLSLIEAFICSDKKAGQRTPLT